MLRHIGCMRLSHIAVMPGLRLNSGNRLLLLGITQNKAVLGTILIDPGVIAGTVIICQHAVCEQRQVYRIAAFVFAMPRQRNTGGRIGAGLLQILIIQPLLLLFRAVSADYNNIITSACNIERIHQRIESAHCLFPQHHFRAAQVVVIGFLFI